MAGLNPAILEFSVPIVCSQPVGYTFFLFIYSFFLLVCFGATSIITQGFFLDLHTEISPGKLKKPNGIPGIKLTLAACKANTQTTVLSITLVPKAPILCFGLL